MCTNNKSQRSSREGAPFSRPIVTVIFAWKGGEPTQLWTLSQPLRPCVHMSAQFWDDACQRWSFVLRFVAISLVFSGKRRTYIYKGARVMFALNFTFEWSEANISCLGFCRRFIKMLQVLFTSRYERKSLTVESNTPASEDLCKGQSSKTFYLEKG